MDAVEYVSLESDAGVTPIPFPLQPRVGTIGRNGIRILDLRTRPEPSTLKLPPQRIRQILAEYSRPVPLKGDALYGASDVSRYRGMLFIGNRPVTELIDLTWKRDEKQRHIRDYLTRRIRQETRYQGLTAILETPGKNNYFHWMTELLPRIAVIARSGLHEALDRIFIPFGEVPSFARASLRLVAPELMERVKFGSEAPIRCETALFFLNDRSYVDDNRTNTRFTQSTAILSDLLDGLLARVGGEPNGVVLISRADAPSRKLVNEAEVVRSLAPLGAEAVTMSGKKLWDQMKLMYGARMVLGVHGAGLTNVLYMRPGTHLVEFTHAQYAVRMRSFADIAAYRGVHYTMVITDQAGDRAEIEGNVGNDLVIDPRKLPDLVRALTSRLAGTPNFAA